MNAEQIFYATKEEQEEFLTLFKNKFDKVEKSEYGSVIYFYCGKEFIHMEISEKWDGIYTEGRIARKTLEKGEDSNSCDKLFTEMKKWLKNHYFCTKMLRYREDKETIKDVRESRLQAKCLSPKVLELYRKENIILKAHTGTPWVEIPKDV